MKNEKPKFSRRLSDKEQKERYELLKAHCETYYSGSYADEPIELANYARFSGLTVEGAKKLIEAGFLDPHETQNDSPETEDMLAFCEKHPGFKMHGYVIGGDRKDARVTFEGVSGDARSLDDMLDFVQTFRYADDLDFSRDTMRCYCWFD